MTRSGDEFDDMDTQGVRLGAGDTIGGAAGAGDDVTRFLMELRALGDGPTPRPSAELAALLGGSTSLRSLDGSRRALVRTALRTATVAAVLLGVLVVAAANHSLPAPAQRVVSHVVNVLTPFHIAPNQAPPVIEPLRPSDKPTPASSPPPPSPRPTPSHRQPVPPAVGGGDDGSGGGDGRPGSGDDRPGADDSTPTSSRAPREDGSDDGRSRRGGSDDRGGGSEDDHSSRRTPTGSPSAGGHGPGDGGSGGDDGPGDD
jgi:hypothetical protein